MKLYKEHLKSEIQPDGVVFENEFCGLLRSQGYPVNDVTDTHVIPASNGEHAYLVQRIETMDKPDGHPKLDIVADEVAIPICSCDDFRYRQSPDVSDETVSPSDVDRCKHVVKAYRGERAKDDDAQVELV